MGEHSMKILVLTQWDYPRFGGSGRMINLELKYFSSKKNVVVYLIYWSDSHKKAISKVQTFTSNHKIIPFCKIGTNRFIRGPLTDMLNLIRFAYLLGRLKNLLCIDVVHAHDPLVGLASIMVNLGKRTVLTLHSPYSQDKFTMGDQIHLSKHRFLMFIQHLFDIGVELLTYNLVSAIIAVSEYEYEHARRFTFLKKPIFIIRNGIDLELYTQDASLRKSLRNNLGIKDDEFVCLYVGRMVRKNGVITIAKAAKLLADIKVSNQVKHNIRFIMIGDGPEIRNIRTLTKDLGPDDLLLLPSMPNEYVIHIGDIFITHLSNLVKGHGLTTLEAMSAKVPVVTGYDSIKAKFFKHKHDIYYVKKDDTMALIKAILTCYKDPSLRRKIAFNAYNKVRNLFDYKQQMHKTYLLFRCIINSRCL